MRRVLEKRIDQALGRGDPEPQVVHEVGAAGEVCRVARLRECGHGLGRVVRPLVAELPHRPPPVAPALPADRSSAACSTAATMLT